MEKVKSLRQSILAAALVLAYGLVPLSVAAQPECGKLTKAVEGDERKYSVTAQVQGAAVFPDIPCAVYWRNNELCATELSDFQFTAKVFDYFSQEPVLMTEAHFVVEARNEPHPVAFIRLEEAQEFIAANGGRRLDYQELVSHPFN